MNNLRRIDLNLLVILEALLAERHISRAAERLHMSQPAVSHALGRLRQLFDDPLLVRGAQGMAPTARALELNRPLAEALRQVHAVLGPTAFDPATAERTFRLGMSDYGAAAVLPALIKMLRREAPGVVLRVSQHSREAMAAQVADGELDLALGVFPQLPDGLRTETLFEEQFACALDAATLADGQHWDLETYLARPHALVAVRPDSVDEIDRALAACGARRHIALTLPHWSVAPALIAGTDLVLTAARRCLSHAPSLAILPVPFALAPFAFTQIWHARADSDPGHAWLRARLAEAAQR
ncbi:LysR substrate-binding domain-containing protein [Neisseriaceae bacterium JH1-16]|nr:LysR substrate-binding domain-containing protein [Neisseriaceae bacterium JH1-16]